MSYSPSALIDTRESATASAALRVYLVEDNAIIRDNLIDMLQELVGIDYLGFSEQEQDAGAWFAKHSDDWDLAIIDIFLKQGTGIGVVRKVQQRQPHQRAVVLSSYATPDVRKRCAELGVDAVFDKSTDIEDLVDYCLQLRDEAA